MSTILVKHAYSSYLANILTKCAIPRATVLANTGVSQNYPIVTAELVHSSL